MLIILRGSSLPTKEVTEVPGDCGNKYWLWGAVSEFINESLFKEDGFDKDCDGKPEEGIVAEQDLNEAGIQSALIDVLE